MSTQIKEIMSLEDKAKHKLKQLNEACSMLEDLEWKLSWALDFSQYESINEILSPLQYQVADALEEMEDKRDYLEEEIESYKTDKALNEKEFDSSCDLVYNID